jgi:hypothetical protein
MKVLLEIPDNEAQFGMKVLNSLSFVKKAKPISSYNASILNDLKEAVDEMNDIKSGKRKAKSLEAFLDEL